jgi:hypothetical protein
MSRARLRKPTNIGSSSSCRYKFGGQSAVSTGIPRTKARDEIVMDVWTTTLIEPGLESGPGTPSQRAQPTYRKTGCGEGTIETVNVLLTEYSRKITDFNIVELNEAFAVQALGCIRQFDLGPSKVNVHRGSIAVGLPLGCSGARILTMMVHTRNANQQ